MYVSITNSFLSSEEISHRDDADDWTPWTTRVFPRSFVQVMLLHSDHGTSGTQRGGAIVSSLKRSGYTHRANRDGTIDSVCGRCLMTICRSTWEAELEAREAVHACKISGSGFHPRMSLAVSSPESRLRKPRSRNRAVKLALRYFGA